MFQLLMAIPGNECLFNSSESLVQVNSQWGYMPICQINGMLELF